MNRFTWLTLTLALVAPAIAAQPLVDGAWLQQRLNGDKLMVLDIRNRIGGGSKVVYAQGHIPGAIHSDYLKAGWRTKVDGVVGMLPSVNKLEGLIGSLGIDNDSHVVIVPAGVSASDYGSATRVYWTFKVLGHDEVSILDGGYALWVKEGRPVEKGVEIAKKASFKGSLRPEMRASRDDVLAAVTADDVRIIDNRPQAQFVGKVKHKKAARAGTIPNAVNIPQGRFFDASSGRFASTKILASLWKEAGADDRTQITYCNTGHWGALGWFASSELLGYKKTRLYDGSMMDWSAQDSLPMIYTQK